MGVARGGWGGGIILTSFQHYLVVYINLTKQKGKVALALISNKHWQHELTLNCIEHWLSQATRYCYLASDRGTKT